MRQIISTITLCLLLTFAACTGASNDGAGGDNARKANTTGNTQGANSGNASAQKPADAEVVVRASAGAVSVKAGGQAEAEVRLDIIDGYHVNANPPTDKNLIGTQLTVVPAGGIEAGAPVYPKALLKKFEFDERPLAVYEREAIIKLPLRVAASATKGQQTLQAKVRVQPCNDQACLPPRTIETSLTVNVN